MPKSQERREIYPNNGTEKPITQKDPSAFRATFADPEERKEAEAISDGFNAKEASWRTIAQVEANVRDASTTITSDLRAGVRELLKKQGISERAIQAFFDKTDREEIRGIIEKTKVSKKRIMEIFDQIGSDEITGEETDVEKKVRDFIIGKGLSRNDFERILKQVRIKEIEAR